MDQGVKISAKICAIYAAVGGAWILFSDEILAYLVHDQSVIMRISIFKGWFYVIVSATMLYLLIRRYTDQVVQAEAEIRMRNEDLAETEEELLQQIDQFQRIQDELYETNQTLTTLFQASPMAIIALDCDGLVTQWNQSAEWLFGWEAEEITGRPCPVMPDNDQDASQGFFENTLQGEVLNNIEVQRRKKDGGLIYVSLSTAPVRDARKAIAGIIMVMADIGERKEAEQAVRKSHQLYEELINSIDGIVWELDVASFRFTFVSKRAEEILGYPVEQWLNDSTFWQNHLHPDDRIWAVDFCTTATAKMEDHEFEYRFVTADGGFVWLRDIVTVVQDDGQPLKLRGVMFDITDKKTTEQMLLRERSLLRCLIDSIPDLIFFKDRESVYLGCNKAFEGYVGLKEEEIVGRTDLDLFPREAGESFRDMDRKMLAEGRSWQNDEWIKYPDGRDVLLDTLKTPFFGADGQILGLIGISRNITSRKQAEKEIQALNTELEQRVRERTAQLEAANKELETFSFSVSHDLRAPLRHIDGFSRALLEDCAEQLDAAGKEHLLRLRQAGQRMAQLIDDLLMLSKVSRLDINRQPVNLSRMAQVITLELKQSKPERQVTARIEEDVTVNGDARLLRILMENLLANAWKYTGKRQDALIEFGAVYENGENVYFVRDNGVGFDMSYADKLFAPFQRLHRYDEFEGTGVGLATVQRIVHRHGGRIWAESSVGSGATFYFTLSGVT